METRNRMTSLKNNQAKNHFGSKYDDTREIVEIAQFIRDTTDFRVERHWRILFSKLTGEYGGFFERITESATVAYHPRNPDIILIDKKTGALKLVVEIDGSIHDTKMTNTEERNDEYRTAHVPLLPISKLEIETNIFDLVHRKLEEYFE